MNIPRLYSELKVETCCAETSGHTLNSTKPVILVTFITSHAIRVMVGRQAVEGRHCDVINSYPVIYLQSAKNHEKPLRIASTTRRHASASKELTATFTCNITRSLQSKQDLRL